MAEQVTVDTCSDQLVSSMLQAEGAAQMRDGTAVSELVRGPTAPVGLVTGLPAPGAGRAWVRISVDALWARGEGSCGGRPGSRGRGGPSSQR